ncbi:MAG: GntR family transcriptional regulator [Bacteroides sp.]|nr:GntR family transcriptional regulator [Bacteroides sp.]
MNFNEGKPIYLQIADRIMDDVISGAYAPGARIESVREFAGRVGVNANTVMRTYTWLQERGIIFNKRGIGYFIADDAPEQANTLLRSYFFEREAPYFLERLARFGITPAELSSRYAAFLG